MPNNPTFDGSDGDLQRDLANGRAVEWAEMYALNALSEPERTTLESYLSAADAGLRGSFEERVRSARETLARAYAVDDVEPPAALFDRILAQLPSTLTSPGPAGASEAKTTRASGPTGNPAPTDELASRRGVKERRSRPMGRWLVGAAAAAVIAVGGVSVVQNLQPTSVEQEVLQAQDMQSETYSIPAGGTAELKLSRAEDAAVITLNEVPAPPSGKVYQMWQVPTDGSAPLSIGTMSGDDVEESLVTTVEGIGSSMGFAITVEPDGGSVQPTLPLVAEIPFEA